MAEQAEDKRRIARVRTILAAHAVLGKGLADVACQVKDLSDTGARLTIDDTAVLPDRFELRIPKRGVSHPAVVRWRQGNLVGIEFVDRRRVERVDPATRIRELEAENAELRRRVAEMAERLYAYGDSQRLSI